MKSTGWRWRVALNPVREDFAGFRFWGIREMVDRRRNAIINIDGQDGKDEKSGWRWRVALDPSWKDFAGFFFCAIRPVFDRNDAGCKIKRVFSVAFDRPDASDGICPAG